MKAAVYTAYGGPKVVQIQDVPVPAPNDDEVRIRVRAAALNPHDWRIMRGSPYIFRTMYGGFRKPKSRPGRDVAGDVDAVGRQVTRFKRGDAVFGFCHGGLAEYACTPESRLAFKPQNASYEEVACVPVAGMTALQALRDKGVITPGQMVLINGAAGGVGTFAVQLAKAFGARVTGVCSTRNVELVRSIGAERVIDYTQTDLAQDNHRYDLVVDCVGNRPLSAYARILEQDGSCVIVGAPKQLSTFRLLAYIAAPRLRSRLGTRKFVTFITKANDTDLPALAELISNGQVRPVIDSVYPLNDVARAIAHLEEGHACGKVVVMMPVGG